MTLPRRGERLFRAWADATPAFDQEAGRARFLESAARGRSRATARSGRLTALALAAALAAALWVWRWPSPAPLGFDTASGPGEVGAWLATAPAVDMPLAFSEGTRVVIEPDSRARVERLDSEGASFVLERGKVHARVVHRERTDWRFRAGPFEVRVTGTALEVEWDPERERFAVRVDDGTVVVRGPEMGPSQIVAAGERCIVDLPAHTMVRSSEERAPPRPPDAAPDDGGPVATPPATSTPAPAAPIPAPAPWTVLEQRGDYDGAYASAMRSGMASLLGSSSADQLLRLAQVSLVSGHRDDARAAWLACRRRFPARDQAAMAAYQLGRASSPQEAAGWFETYLREQPAGPLAREAWGRLVEARASAGDDAMARETASRYLSRYPDGPAAPLARSILARTHE